MNRQTKIFLLAASIAFTVSGIVRADNDKDKGKGCSNSTLQGLYIFHAAEFNIVAGVAQPKAIVELIQFNGDGTLTSPGATVSINGVVTRSPPGGTGSCTITEDCAGSLAFGPPGPTFDLFVGLKDSELYMIQTNNGTVFQGTAERVSH
jgi:hypothetical protein